MFFSKYKSVSNKAIHEAVARSFMDMPNVNSARYFLYKNRLAVEYYSNDGRTDSRLWNDPAFKNGCNVLIKCLPTKYGSSVIIWNNSPFREALPKNILEKTGFVYVSSKAKATA